MNKNWKKDFRAIGVLPFISSNDNEHHKPHIHLEYSGQKIVLELPDLVVLAGDMQGNKLKQIKKILNTELVQNLINLFYEKNPKLKRNE